jgi:mRNA-degrading endonuclease RelE of RelBE toxin-antitoxin system
VNSVTTEKFRRAYERLPENIKEAARQAYKLWKKNPSHPSLAFKLIHSTNPVYSVRIGLSYRAIGVKQKNTIVWFWIGSHADYDKMIKGL